MSDWQSVCIGDIANIPKKQPVANPREIELLTVRLYANGVERTGKYPKATERGRPYFAREAGEILIGRQNFHNGGIGIVSESDAGLICSNAITSLVPTTKADRDFLFYLLSNEQFRKQIQRQSEGTGQSEISETKILSLEIPLPPLPEQKKIAEILSGIDALSEKITTQITKLENLKVALICEFLSEGARKAETTSSDGGDFQGNCGWKMHPVSAIADFISGYAFSSADFIDTGILCIRMGNLYQNKFHENRASVFLPSEYLTKHPRFQVEAGDLLISMTGTAGKRDYGFVVEVPDGTSKGLLNQRVGKIVTKTNHSKGYIKEVMRSPFYLEQLYEYGSGTKQANLTAGQIMGVIFPVPNLPTQLRIAQSLSSIQKNIDSLAVLSCKQIELLLSIRNELLSGRKRVSDARVLEGVGI